MSDDKFIEGIRIRSAELPDHDIYISPCCRVYVPETDVNTYYGWGSPMLPMIGEPLRCPKCQEVLESLIKESINGLLARLVGYESQIKDLEIDAKRLSLEKTALSKDLKRMRDWLQLTVSKKVPKDEIWLVQPAQVDIDFDKDKIQIIRHGKLVGKIIGLKEKSDAGKK